MSFFEGLTGKRKTPRLAFYSPESMLRPELQPLGRAISSGALGLLADDIEGGESGLEAQLFHGSRRATLDDFASAVANLGTTLNRRGLASSGFAGREGNALALGLGELLSSQDAARAAALLQRRRAAATQGLNSILALAAGSKAVPVVRQPGLFDGFGTSLIGGATQSLGGLLGGGVASGIGGLFR